MVGVAALGQHIKLFEGNYGVTAAVSWRGGRREVITGLSMEKGRPRRELGNLAILNILRHIIIVWFVARWRRRRRRKEKKKRTGVALGVCMCACAGATSCVSHYYTAVISGLLFSNRLSVRLPAGPSVPPSRTKRTVTRRECAAQLARATITYGLALPPLARISPSHTISRSHVAAN